MSATTIPVALIGWKPVRKGALLGFAGVRLGRALIVHDVPVLAGRNGAWASLPSKPQIGSDGTVRRNDAGKIQYSPILEWADKEASRRFSDAVIDALHREFPDALTPDDWTAEAGR